MALDVKALAQGMKFLIASEGTKQNEQNSSFVENIELLISNFECFVREKETLSAALAAKREQFQISFDPNESLYWRFVAKSLCLLCALVDLLSEVQTPAVTTLPSPPHAPQHMLGAADQKLVQCLLQRVVYVGIYPYLLPGVDSLVKLRLSHLRGAVKVAAPVEQCAWYLYKCSRMLLWCAEDETLGPLILAHHLSDLLVALIQVCYGPRGDVATSPGRHCAGLKEPATPGPHLCQDAPLCALTTGERCVAITDCDREWSAKALQGLLDRVHQPVVVRELLCLQSGVPRAHNRDPVGEGGRESVKNLRWLQRACGRLLSERLMKRNGVQSVLRGILDAMSAGSGEGTEEGGGGSAEDSAQNWKKCQDIAKIIAHCPSQASSPEHYYSLVCPQVLDLLHLPADEIRRQVLRVTVAILNAMVAQNGPLADRFLTGPLLQPLEVLCDARVTPREALAERLQICLSDLSKICEVLEVTSPLVPVFTRYMPVIFDLSRVCDGEQDCTEMPSAKQQPGPLVRSPATTVLCFLLLAVDTGVALEHLISLFVAPEHRTVDIKQVDPSWTLSPGPGPPGAPIALSLSVCNEGGLGEVDEMEGRACHVIRLLRTGLKPSKMVGKLCLLCLSHIERVLHKAVYKSSAGCGPRDLSVMTKLSGATSSALLDVEGSSSREHMPTLFLVASLCEHMTMEVVEQVDLHQILEILLQIVTAYADFVGSDSTRTQGLLLVQPDLDSLPGSTIPLSIAIGLLSSVAGGAKKVSRKDRPLLTQFLQPLETVSSHCPDPELQTQASELRICIATMGAAWSSELQDKLSANLTGKAKGAGRKESKSKLIEELPVSTSPSPSGVCSSGIAERHTLNVEKRATTIGVEVHPDGVEVHPDGVEVHPDGVEVYPDRIEGHSAGIGGDHTMSSQPTAFQTALGDLRDSLLPIQAHGLLTLAKLLEARDSEALACSSSLMVIFKENLKHTDSYVYLAAIDGLVALASTTPKDVIPLLCQEYVYLASPDSSSQEKKGLPEKVQHVLKLGEALVRAARALGDVLPHYSETLLSAIMVNVQSPDTAVRTSALSNLAEVCGLLHWSFGRVQNEVLGCVVHILQTDLEPSVRQAALLVLKQLIKGLSQDAIQVLGGSLRDVYRLLKQVEAVERDPLTQAHAQAALGELDSVMRTYLFPQQTLTKKILVMDPL